MRVLGAWHHRHVAVGVHRDGRARLLHVGRDIQPVPGDLHRPYGPKYATTNAGLLYTAKGTASFLVPVASWLQAYSGGWHAVFAVAAVANLAVAATALFVVKPLHAAQRGAVPIGVVPVTE